MDISLNTSSAFELMAAFCRRQFTDLDAGAAAKCLARDIHWFNPAQDSGFLDYTQTVQRLKTEAAQTPSQYLLTFNNIYENNYPSGYGTAGATMLLSGGGDDFSLPISVFVRSEGGVSKICSLNMPLPTSKQKLKSPDTTDKYFREAISCILQREYKSVIRMDLNTLNCTILFSSGAFYLPHQLDYQSYVLNLVNRAVVKTDYERVFHAISPQELKKQLVDHTLYRVMFDVRTEGGKTQRHEMQFTYIDRKNNIVLITRQDVTEVVNAEKAAETGMKALLEKAEHANSVKSKFLSRMSHEFHTPLSVILEITSQASAAKSLEEMSLYIEKIKSSGHILLNQIDDVLNVNILDNSPILLRNEPYTFKEFFKHIELMIRPQADKKSVNFTIDASASPCGTMLIDKVRFSRIFFTLLSNAVKFTPIQGSIDFQIVELNYKDSICLCRFTVKDNGIGIPEEFLRKLKELFSGKAENADEALRDRAMGLWTVKRLADAMDAKISVDSQFGVGTTFALELEIQMCDDYYSSITPEGEIDLSSLSGKRVLLCEDHPIHADQIIKMLESVGIKCERAANGLEGMTVFNFMPVGYFDAILMDIHMPVMDGIELTEKLRSMDRIDSRIIPVIAITSNAYDEDRQTAIDAGMNDYIAKPVDREQLYKVLWRAVCLDR